MGTVKPRRMLLVEFFFARILILIHTLTKITQQLSKQKIKDSLLGRLRPPSLRFKQ